MILTFLGTSGCVAGVCGLVPFALARQLLAETLVAVVETLRTLALLYRVNADVDVPALDVVLVELRQLPDNMEDALELTAWLRIELTDPARSESCPQWSREGFGLRDDVYTLRPCELPTVDTGGRTRRPRGQSSTGALGCDGGAAFSPMIRLVTLLTVEDMGKSVSEGSSTGPSAEPLLLPKLSFHLDCFLTIDEAPGTELAGVGAWIFGSGGTGGMEPSMLRGTAYIATGSKGRFLLFLLVTEDWVVLDLIDDACEARLISRARVCEALARVSSVSSFGVVRSCDPDPPLPLRAPRFRRLLFEGERDSARSPLASFSLSSLN